MLIIRPIRSSDFSALKQIAIESGHGFTSLPNNEPLLLSKIERAEQSFAAKVSQPGQQSYLFVLEDSDSGDIMGITGIEAAVGLGAPFYHYHLASHMHYSPSVGVRKLIKILNLCNDYTGASEVCTLFVREKFRKGLSGQLLSRVRYLFMANHPERFSNLVIAEMRGVSNEHGHSPFWAWLEEHFFGIDFPTADYLVGIGDKAFIAELMPKYPIYTSLLSQQAQDVIGKVHSKTMPALRLLEKEGFVHRGYVDLFDAGPTVEVALKNIRTVRQSHTCSVEISEVGQEFQAGGESIMLCNTQVQSFRATVSQEGHYDALRDKLIISPHLAQMLLLAEGDNARCIAL
ncbi:MAG: arginine N-succinyltransferase [Paraglaciecola sp.]|jgi:arginine N-succinyltransferase